MNRHRLFNNKASKTPIGDQVDLLIVPVEDAEARRQHEIHDAVIRQSILDKLENQKPHSETPTPVVWQ